MPEYTGGNRVSLLANGAQYFPALVAEIDAATSEIFLETYLFAGDQTGSLVAGALARAAARGVQTRLLLDGFGARDFAPRLRRQLERAGAEIAVFRPSIVPPFLRSPRAPLRRMHRKLACVDGRVAFVGGINVIDDYDPAWPGAARYDFAVRVEGPVAAEVRLAAARLWARVSWASLGRRWPGVAALRAELSRQPATQREGGPGGQRAALVIRDSLRHRADIEKAYLERIEAARSEVLIANAYFFPTRGFRQALARAARRGVKVVLLLQGRVEYVLQHYASRALYRPLLGAGVRIHEYYPSFLHAKVAVFDARWATVGSSNIDPFSLGLAREANVFVDDSGFAGDLRAALVDAIEHHARPVPRSYWRRLTPLLRLRIWASYRLARLAMAFFGFGGAR